MDSTHERSLHTWTSWSVNHFSLKKGRSRSYTKSPKSVQSAFCPTHQASFTGWPEDGKHYLIHKMQTGEVPYPYMHEDSCTSLLHCMGKASHLTPLLHESWWGLVLAEICHVQWVTLQVLPFFRELQFIDSKLNHVAMVMTGLHTSTNSLHCGHW